ncbi:LEF-1 [Helicoverpa armigera SNPV]|uniref:Lef-1 n=2 Tax=Alphabaculovirus helarmigerae TaxID=3047947 RepID=Q9E216_9ABAC|nr:lef1-like protein [Helicoverpa zea single nucleopolyhedrovirus]AIG63168.1 LEF-1 [Helicoverpa SNPV AC53]AIG63306.1 LEF-1 [Helicoverpa armigera SNPV]AAL56134.1 ORF128 [Helicoverpa zea single nucleopolyhedrovirus]AHN05503.1 lef-1 [Helicoverpa zea single nucleopolyhedrovirus]
MNSTTLTCNSLRLSFAMQTTDCKYSEEQARLIWDSVAFNTFRKWAFMVARPQRWLHPDKCFDDFDNFYRFLIQNRISDVHVKALPDNGGREWVIDVDIHESDPDRLHLKTRVAALTFAKFFGDNISRIVHSGNRGIHVWLKHCRFRMNASKQIREKYYKVFDVPKSIQLERVRTNSFLYALISVIDEPEIKSTIDKLYANKTDRVELIKCFFPEVDQQIFCNFTQIRAPFSYNYKGQKYSKEIIL